MSSNVTPKPLPTPDVSPETPVGAAAEVGALERLQRLNEEMRARARPEVVEAPKQRAPKRLGEKVNALRARRGVKSLIAIIVAVALGWYPLQRLLAATSAEATVNARLINLRAPIDGKVSLVAPSIAVGTEVEPDEPLLRVTNVRADRGRLDDLRRTVDGLRSEITVLSQRLGQLQGIEKDVIAQRNAFQEGRIHQLEAKAAELAVQITTAEAQHEDAKEALERSRKLRQSGSHTVATLLHAERDYKVSKLAIEAARIRLEGNKIELEAARKGLFVGDSYNDLPRSAQRLDEIRQQTVEVSSQLDERKARLAYLEKELVAETDLFTAHSHAIINATVRGRIWEVLTANGEEVRTGQDLLRILDCAGAVVTATVSEAVYNKLWVGQPAQFRLRGERQQYGGSVVGLTGLAAAGSNFAIEQTALTREPYHVTIAVPGLAARRECNVGRTGQVTFDTSASAANAEPARIMTAAAE